MQLTAEFIKPVTVTLLFSFLITLLLIKEYNRMIPKVILISIDGFRSDYLDINHTPHLARLANEGIMASYMEPQFPTMTFPSHYTLVTGLYSEVHGIINNEFMDPQTGDKFSYSNESKWWLAEPIWNYIQPSLRSGTCYWPGSEVEIFGKRPNLYLEYNKNVTSIQRVEKVLEWIENENLNLITLYFDEVDVAGHKFGPSSPQVKDAISHVNAALERLFERLPEDYNTVIVSDHGMSQIDKLITISDILDPADITEVYYGPMTLLYTDHVDKNYKILKESGKNFKVFKKDELPDELHYKNSKWISPIILIADSGFSIGDSSPPGMHGFMLPNNEMNSIFIAKGPRIVKNSNSYFEKENRIDPFSSINVYEFICNLLDVRPRPNNGTEVLNKILV